MKLYCPACGEPARNTPPVGPYPRNIRVPRHSHHDGTPLCPTVGADGYTPHWPYQRDLDIRTLRRGRFAIPAHHHCRGPEADCALNLDEPHDICVALRHDDHHLPLGAPGFARSLNAAHTEALADWLRTHTDDYLHLVDETDHERAYHVIAATLTWLTDCAGHRGFRVHTFWPTT
ncbi:hypothetical protein AB0B66_40455 [Catellatospora sp. NPDC049111]|uniref:hypothetical protein n=1 Tax=Catellatospora sp. NPDC049111 TaxID=3155271 RepID=UPI0034035247